ncbi:MAG: hypothetical protein MK193_07865 [Lentisphaeria bacterium]|nr:hypothetical protein [Lentisphaeria bacterium]
MKLYHVFFSFLFLVSCHEGIQIAPESVHVVDVHYSKISFKVSKPKDIELIVESVNGAVPIENHKCAAIGELLINGESYELLDGHGKGAFDLRKEGKTFRVMPNSELISILRLTSSAQHR